jgi:plasmid stabilization system protein ParE
MPAAGRLRVVLSPRFLAELKHQILWIAERNAAAARAAEKRVRVAVRRLGKFPELGRPGRVAGTRELSVPKTRFVIAYRVKGGAVELAALLHARQNWPGEF